MKKILISVLIITTLSILYVFQQARLLEYSYDINSYQKYTCLLVDQNKGLRYNISKLEAPARLEETVKAKEAQEVYIPPAWCKIKIEEELPGPGQEITPVRPFIKVGRIILSKFWLDTEAVAKELNE